MSTSVDRCAALQEQEEDGDAEEGQHARPARALLRDRRVGDELYEQRDGDAFGYGEEQLTKTAKRQKGLVVEPLRRHAAEWTHKELLDHDRHRHQDHAEDKNDGHELVCAQATRGRALSQLHGDGVAHGEGEVGPQRGECVRGRGHPDRTLHRVELERVGHLFGQLEGRSNDHDLFAMSIGTLISEPEGRGAAKPRIRDCDMQRCSGCVYGGCFLQLVCCLMSRGLFLGRVMDYVDAARREHRRFFEDMHVDLARRWQRSMLGFQVHREQFNIVAAAFDAPRRSYLRRTAPERVREAYGVCAILSLWYGTALGCEQLLPTEADPCCVLRTVETCLQHMQQHTATHNIDPSERLEYHALCRAREALGHPLLRHRMCNDATLPAMRRLNVQLHVMRLAFWSPSECASDLATELGLRMVCDDLVPMGLASPTTVAIRHVMVATHSALTAARKRVRATATVDDDDTPASSPSSRSDCPTLLTS